MDKPLQPIPFSKEVTIDQQCNTISSSKGLARWAELQCVLFASSKKPSCPPCASHSVCRIVSGLPNGDDIIACYLKNTEFCRAKQKNKTCQRHPATCNIFQDSQERAFHFFKKMSQAQCPRKEGKLRAGVKGFERRQKYENKRAV